MLDAVKLCLFCKTNPAQTSRSSYCSSLCRGRWKYANSRVSVTCTVCSSEFKRYKYSKETPRCRSCALGGSNNPGWRGGHKYHIKGRFGRDKDGLSWKVQRTLAWERDKYTCQHCGKSKEGRNPDVHHIRPYRLSGSHALDNLISLCQSCHKRADAKCVDLWGGECFGGQVGRLKQPRCVKCKHSRRKKLIDGYCLSCNRDFVLLPKLLSWKFEGKSYSDIEKLSGIPQRQLWHLINVYAVKRQLISEVERPSRRKKGLSLREKV